MKREIENEQKNDTEQEATKNAGKIEMKDEMNKRENMFSEATQNDVKQNETMLSENARSKCDKMMDKFLMLDKQERIPLDVTFHLLKCKKYEIQLIERKDG